jgi:putative permease
MTDPKTPVHGVTRGGELFPALARALLLLAGLVALLWFMARIQQVLLLAMLVLVLSIAVNAPVTALERHRGWSRGAALGAVAGALTLLGVGLAWLLVPRLVGEIPALASQATDVAQQLARDLGARMGIGDELEQQVDRLVAWGEGALQQAWRLAGSVVGGIVTLIVVVALVLYTVAEPRSLVAGTLHAVPVRHRARTARALARGSKMVVGWVAANAIMGVLKAVAAFLFLSFMEVPGAIVWAILAFFSALVPQVGFYLMSIPPVLMAFAVDPMTALWVAVFFWALSTVLGNFVAPHVQGERMQLHPAYILGMTVAMGYAFGLLGVLIAGPVAGFVKVFFDAFWLERHPEDPEPRRSARIDAILARDPGALPAGDG